MKLLRDTASPDRSPEPQLPKAAAKVEGRFTVEKHPSTGASQRGLLLRVTVFLSLALFCSATPAIAKDRLGTYQSWAAFKDPETPRCYAIAAPEETIRKRKLKPYLSIGFWPNSGVTHQLYVRLSRERSSNSGVTLSAGGRRFRLIADRTGGWAKDRRMDLAIMTAIRSARSLSVESIGRDGKSIVDVYTLRGAPSAIDAAALGCKSQ